MPTLKAVIRYDGTGFAGWQVQPGQRTVQGVIEDALNSMARLPIRIHGAGRTDAGVHALAQVFSFQWPAAESYNGLAKSLSKMLGPEIRVDRVEEAPDGFNARTWAVGKHYAYALYPSAHPDPFLHRYAWRVNPSTDLGQIRALLEHIEGRHDFAGFQGSKSSVTSTVRTIHEATLREGAVVGPCDANPVHHIRFHGDGFLYKMVRNLTGMLVEIARGRMPEEALHERLNAPAPYHGHTAPGRGLTLLGVDYAEGDGTRT